VNHSGTAGCRTHARTPHRKEGDRFTHDQRSAGEGREAGAKQGERAGKVGE
jgi:hypothetical protein